MNPLFNTLVVYCYYETLETKENLDFLLKMANIKTKNPYQSDLISSQDIKSLTKAVLLSGCSEAQKDVSIDHLEAEKEVGENEPLIELLQHV